MWVGTRGLGEQHDWIDTTVVSDVAAMRRVYAEVDAMLERAFDQFTTPDDVFDLPFRDEVLKVTQRWLVMHPITHEFHHRGQMLTMGRVMGHPYPAPPDTDLGVPGDVMPASSPT